MIGGKGDRGHCIRETSTTIMKKEKDVFRLALEGLQRDYSTEGLQYRGITLHLATGTANSLYGSAGVPFLSIQFIFIFI